MNRNLFLAAAAAFLCFSLAACGGGGGGDSPQVASTGTTSGSTTPTGSTGGTAVGSTDPTNPIAPGDGNVYPIPNCTPRNVIVSLQGDSNMHDLFNTGELQADLDTHFGSGAATVLNYALVGDLASDWLYITGDVIVENFGMGDEQAGTDPSVLAANILAMHPTLIMTQMTMPTIYDDAPYVAAEKSIAGTPVADAYTYLQTEIANYPGPRTDLAYDGIHFSNSVLIDLTDNVIAPAVYKQVAPLRCQLN